MREQRKVFVITALGLLVAVAFVVGLKKSGLIGRPEPPAKVLAQKVTMVDSKTLDPVEISLDQWRKGGQHGRWTHPRTGRKTLVSAMPCATCGRWIPMPDPPRGPGGMVDTAAYEAMLLEYKCPLCGGPAMLPFREPH